MNSSSLFFFSSFNQIHGKHGKMRPRALKDLTKEHLHMEIQTGEHDPVSGFINISSGF